MAELPSNLKRKTRNRSGLEAVSPDGKRICEASNEEIESSADDFTAALTMTEIIVQQLQQDIVLERLTSVEGKLDGVLEKEQRLETAPFERCPIRYKCVTKQDNSNEESG